MLHMFKRICWAILFVVAAQAASAFSLLGPYDIWQTDTIGYNLPGDIGAPMSQNNEFRWNQPVIYYAYDERFTEYFHDNGKFAIDQAIAMINNLTNLSSYSPELSEFPMDALRFNYEAQALGLIDLKSIALNLILEELGLTDPDRFVWTLRGRRTIPGLSCPFMEYTVALRNLDPLSNAYSPYINGSLWSYYITENCGQGGPPSAVTVNFLVDPTSVAGTPAASIDFYLKYGAFFTGLTRDDVGGLRYLWATNNYNIESSTDDSLQFVTNRFSQLIVTTNLATLVAQSLTNDPVALSNLYPGLIINSVSNFFTNVITTNFTAYFTNGPFSTAYTPASLILVTNFTTNAETRFLYKFGNVITNTYFTKGFVTTIDTTNAPAGAYSPAGTLTVTNVSVKTGLSNFVNGTFFLLPSNACGVQILSTQLVNLVTFTNIIPAITNLPGVTNLIGSGFNRQVITYATNYSFVVYPILCQTNMVDKREGIDRIRFIRVEIDPVSERLTDGSGNPITITNIYNLTSGNNTNLFGQETFRRVLTRPDWTFRALDFSDVQMGTTVARRTEPFYTAVHTGTGQTNVGPGILQGPIDITFNTTGPLIINIFSPGEFLSGLSQISGATNYAWGSFDGSTNAPIVYQEGWTVTNLDSLVFFSVGTTILPAAQVGYVYSTQLQPRGGNAPYVWSLNASSAALPDGLTLSPDGLITGTPTTDGTYDFTIDVSEGGGRTATQDLTIIIKP
jgi:hypothetical protein